MTDHNTPPRFPLGFFPTPLHRLHRLSGRYPDYQLFIKRDDQTGLASGGNKTRKLEFLVGEALAQGCDTIVTAGAQQSNHCRQTAAAANVAGMACHLLVRGAEPKEYTGNLLLSKLLGATIHFCGEEIRAEHSTALLQELRASGRKPYHTPVGGSTLTGALGFAEAARELKEQLESMQLQMDYIVFASCSGGTQAGLLLGKALYGLEPSLLPVSIEKTGLGSQALEETVMAIAEEGRGRLGIGKAFDPEDLALVRGYDEAGYGVLTRAEKEAIRELAALEGIFLDPVYTGRAFHAMTDMLRSGRIEPGSNVLFWHTGGLPANFHYGNQLL
jgi:D-cysteine desulfhydrase